MPYLYKVMIGSSSLESNLRSVFSRDADPRPFWRKSTSRLSATPAGLPSDCAIKSDHDGTTCNVVLPPLVSLLASDAVAIFNEDDEMASPRQHSSCVGLFTDNNEDDDDNDDDGDVSDVSAKP